MKYSFYLIELEEGKWYSHTGGTTYLRAMAKRFSTIKNAQEARNSFPNADQYPNAKVKMVIVK